MSHELFGCSLVLVGCGIEAIPCQPGCKDQTTRIVCDANGDARTEACPRSSEECAAATCNAGTCALEPAVGAPCGVSGSARCNEGFACMGGQFSLAAAPTHTCLATDDGKVWCWGDNHFGELGDGTVELARYPVLVRDLPGHAMQVSPGYAHTCVLLRDGKIACWGNNTVGQCGTTPSPEPSTPNLVDAPGVRFTSVAAGLAHTCAVTEDKGVYCWGNTLRGQCGTDPATTGEINIGPRRVPDLDGVERIVTIKHHTCATRSRAPHLVCWGSNSHLEEGDAINHKLGPNAADVIYRAVPIEVDLGAPVVHPGMGFESTYAVTDDSRVFAWGRNSRLQLGTQSQVGVVAIPSEVMIETAAGLRPLTGAEALVRSSGSDQCVKMRNQFAFETPFMCWGADDWGELGAGTPEEVGVMHPYPIPVRAVPPNATALTRGDDHACAAVPVNSSTEIWCYGRPGFLGNGTRYAPDRNTPGQWLGTPVVWKAANFGPALK